MSEPLPEPRREARAPSSARRSTPFAGALLAALTASATALGAACVGPPPTWSEPRAVVDEAACAGWAPMCVGSCGAPDELGAAECRGGAWHCPAGVREDLCCDALAHPESCPSRGEACDAAAPCDAGYTCVRSAAFPLPVDGGEPGVCLLGDWSLGDFEDCAGAAPPLWPDALRERGPTSARRAVQVEGVVGVQETCLDLDCTPDDPCCQPCTGSYTLTLVTSGGESFAVSLHTETVGCAGTNCGYTCTPLQPGRRYRVWGLWDPDADGGGGALMYAGHCGG
ncbi:MAG: hypothetical protein U1F43_05140 [Myxococcota bacterium]